MIGKFANPLRYGLVGLALLAALTLAIAPFSKSLVEQWSRRDVESRSRLVYTAIQGPVVRALADNDHARLANILQGSRRTNAFSPLACATNVVSCAAPPS